MAGKFDSKNEELFYQLISTPEERKQYSSSDEPEGLVFDIKRDPYNHLMRVVFSRWKPFILRAIGFDQENPTYFSRMYKQLPITQKVLSQNLKDMQEDGLIYRNVLPEVPPRVEYCLTPQGKSLLPLLDMLYDWGWNDMKSKGMPVDALGEMWHGYRERDEKLMFQPYSKVIED